MTALSFAEGGYCLPKILGKLRAMTSGRLQDATPEQIRRLGAAVLARREELGIRQEDVTARGGGSPSTTTLSKLENGIGPAPSRKTIEGLDRGLRWVPGSARGVLLNGADPQPLPDSEPGAPLRGSLNLSLEQRDRLVEILGRARQSIDDAINVLGS